MKVFKILTVSLLTSLTFSSFSGHAATKSNNETKLVIGPTVSVAINEADLDFIGRVDTGAATTSINAQKIKASKGQVEYSIINKHGEESRFSSEIVKESFVRNAEAREKRYYVYLTVKHRGVKKKTLVNLNDRSHSNYKILLGRNWLSGSYVVDIDK